MVVDAKSNVIYNFVMPSKYGVETVAERDARLRAAKAAEEAKVAANEALRKREFEAVREKLRNEAYLVQDVVGDVTRALGVPPSSIEISVTERVPDRRGGMGIVITQKSKPEGGRYSEDAAPDIARILQEKLGVRAGCVNEANEKEERRRKEEEAEERRRWEEIRNRLYDPHDGSHNNSYGENSW